MITHGLASTYRNYACRCGPCTQANTERSRTERAERRARIAADPSLARHGQADTYQNWGCRCEACTRANSEESTAKRRQQRLTGTMRRPLEDYLTSGNRT